jgi:ABC-2 type transport system ATP-binding protein
MTKTAVMLSALEHHYHGQWRLSINDLTLEYGKIYGLIGRNGAGKSTLMRLIGGIELPQNGLIQRFTDHIGFINTTTSYPGFFSINNIADLFIQKAKANNGVWDGERFQRVLDVFSINDHMQFKQLSTGEKSGLNLAILLAQRPKLWLLDEPTLGIDLIAVNQCLSLLSEYFLDDEPCVIFATHQMRELERLADQALIIREGGIAWQGDVDDLHGLRSSFTEGIESILKGAAQGHSL